MKTVSVDFDGVIHQYSKGWHNGAIYDPPVEGAIEGLKKLLQEYAVVVHTSRDPHQVYTYLTGLGFTCAWEVKRMQEFWNGRGEILVSNHKYPSIAYIDDRAIRFHDWTQALAELAGHEEKTKVGSFVDEKELLELAWTLVCNADTRTIDERDDEWGMAARRFREQYFKMMGE